MGPGQVNGVTNIDNVISSYEGTGGFDNVQNAQRVRQFLDFLGTSNSGEVATFREKYAQHLLETLIGLAAIHQSLRHPPWDTWAGRLPRLAAHRRRLRPSGNVYLPGHPSHQPRHRPQTCVQKPAVIRNCLKAGQLGHGM